MEAKKLYRSRTDRMLAGVCAGIAEYFNIDPAIVRILAVVLFFADGLGFLFYIVAMAIIPENKEDFIDVEFDTASGDEDTDSGEEKQEVKNRGKKNDAQRLFGIILIGLGVFFIFDKWLYFIRWHRLWPLVLVVLGIYFIFRGVKGDE
ncbi:MAG: PspC domain-containing protein [Halanaerobiaceae bacterium]|nr:PspC domain-containing protein [Halanaerobiaceae bacterium]